MYFTYKIFDIVSQCLDKRNSDHRTIEKWTERHFYCNIVFIGCCKNTTKYQGKPFYKYHKRILILRKNNLRISIIYHTQLIWMPTNSCHCILCGLSVTFTWYYYGKGVFTNYVDKKKWVGSRKISTFGQCLWGRKCQHIIMEQVGGQKKEKSFSIFCECPP